MDNGGLPEVRVRGCSGLRIIVPVSLEMVLSPRLDQAGTANGAWKGPQQRPFLPSLRLKVMLASR